MHGVGVGHLDLKPSNVILRASAQPVLVDFGLAGRHLRPGCGTASYGAPEVWGIVPEGAPPTPMAADVYSFGCLAYEVLTGETLFDAPNEVALISAHLMHDGVPAPVEAAGGPARDGRHRGGDPRTACARRREPGDGGADPGRAAQVGAALGGKSWPVPV